MNKILLIFLFCLLSYTSHAQKKYPKTMGFRLGFNIASLSPLPSGYTKNGNVFGFSGGIYGRISTAITGFFVQPELMFNQKGGKINNMGFSNNSIMISTLDIPILVGKKLFKNHIRLGIGPVFSFVLSAKEKITLASTGTSSTGDVPNVNKSLFAYQIGLGADIQKFSIDLRYEKTFTDFIEGSNNLRPATFQFTVGYSFL